MSGLILREIPEIFRDSILFPDDIDEGSLLRVEKQGFYVYYHGYASAPEVTTGTDEFQYFYVNGRFVRDKTLKDSVKSAYKGSAPAGRFPLCALFLTIKPYRLDEFERDGENIVRFYDPYNVGSFCRDAVIEALQRGGRCG
jgi:DNA mismatch repair protein MutL